MARVAKLQVARDASAATVGAAQPPDFVQMLREAPSVAQVMQTLQQAADQEGAQVVSLQADDHVPTDSALGHLDLVLSIKAPYPSVVVVIQQVLERYPGATLRQFTLTHSVAAAGFRPLATALSSAGGSTPLAPTSDSEAHVMLSFWRRPLGVAQALAPLATTAQTPRVVASGASGVAAAASSARGAVARVVPTIPAARVMRGALKWSLVATGVVSAIAIALDPGGQGTLPAVVGARRVTSSEAPPSSDPYGNWRNAVPSTAADASTAAAPLPSGLPERDMEAGQRDIFAAVTTPPPPPPPPPPPAPPPPPPAPPAPPPMNWRAIGSMLTPVGERVVWLAKGNDEISVKPGMQLDDGYVVQSIDQDNVMLVYPSIGKTVRIALPHVQPGSP